ncbi:hypothetical protein [Candidatus Nitrosocosmicus sp. R]
MILIILLSVQIANVNVHESINQSINKLTYFIFGLAKLPLHANPDSIDGS